LSSAFALDQGLEPRVKHRGLLLQAAHLERTPEQRLVDVQGGSHLHELATSMQIAQSKPSAPRG
jgi:hypothetical protein